MRSPVTLWPLALIVAIHSGCGASDDGDDGTATPTAPGVEGTDEPTDSGNTETPPVDTTEEPTIAPTPEPTPEPTLEPTPEPTDAPTSEPTDAQTQDPTIPHTPEQTAPPPTDAPTFPPPTPENTPEPTPDGFPSNPPPTPSPTPDTPTACVPNPGHGLTYRWATTDVTLGVVTAGCNTTSGACMPYAGDTACSEVRPVLCIKQDGSPSPSPSLTRWIGGSLATTPPVLGSRLTSQQAGDQLCKDTWGTGWRMAEWHDQPNGPSMQGYGKWESDLPLWVAINDQAGNCWNSVKTTCDSPDTRMAGHEEPSRTEKSNASKGMTYDWLSTNTASHAVRMGCYATSGSCDPYVGDTSCDAALPLLCIEPKASDLTSPGGDWTGGKLGATPPLKGTRFASVSDANTMCQRTFGTTWRVAEFHDYSSGFSMSGEGLWVSDSRMWVDVNDQPGNCWSHSIPGRYGSPQVETWPAALRK